MELEVGKFYKVRKPGKTGVDAVYIEDIKGAAVGGMQLSTVGPDIVITKNVWDLGGHFYHPGHRHDLDLIEEIKVSTEGNLMVIGISPKIAHAISRFVHNTGTVKHVNENSILDNIIKKFGTSSDEVVKHVQAHIDYFKDSEPPIPYSPDLVGKRIRTAYGVPYKVDGYTRSMAREELLVSSIAIPESGDAPYTVVGILDSRDPSAKIVEVFE